MLLCVGYHNHLFFKSKTYPIIRRMHVTSADVIADVDIVVLPKPLFTK